MNLEVFSFIENCVLKLQNNFESYLDKSIKLENYFRDILIQKDSILYIRSRVKEQNSLKEKILRQNLYEIYDDADALFDNLPDLIGVRLECRFISDEKHIYNELKNIFRVQNEDGSCSSYMDDKIRLYLNTKQPMIQKNGFEIYKIDGYINSNPKVNFELQIKSLVNVFWGDIDHKILYKNYNDINKEMFLSEIMGSIKENLEMIDRELAILFNHINHNDSNFAESSKHEIIKILSKLLNEIYSKKMKKNMGFVIEFSNISDSILNYLFSKCFDDEDYFTEEYSRILNRIKFIESKDIDFTTRVDFPEDFPYFDNFSESLGNTLKTSIDKNFKWNLFFKMLFDLEKGENEKIVGELLLFLKYRYYESIHVAFSNIEMNEKTKSEMVEFILELLASEFNKKPRTAFITQSFISKVNIKIFDAISHVVDIWDKTELKESISKNIYDLFNKLD